MSPNQGTGGWRLFFGVLLPEAIADSVYEWAHNLFGGVVGARWVRPAQLHITLAFLGETDPQRAEDLVRDATAIATGVTPFDAVLGGIGAFPSFERARVIWLGCREGSTELSALARGLARTFAVPDRRYTPHVTLARLRVPRALPLDEASLFYPAAGVEHKFAEGDKGDIEHRVAPRAWSFHVEAFTLFRSRLKPTGAEYEGLEHIPLSK